MCAEEWREKIDLAAREGKEILNLNGCDIGKEEERMQYLSEFLKVNTTVNALWLWCNQIDDEGMLCLSQGLQVNQALKELYLDYNQIGDEGLQHLTKATRVNTSLVDVVVFSNRCSDVAKRDFEAWLADMPAREAAREEFLSQEASRLVKSAAKR